FVDPGGAESIADYAATINWGGPGTGSTAGTIVANADGSFSVKGSFAYAEEGNYTITVTISHEETTPQMITSSATVADAPLVSADIHVAVVGGSFNDTGYLAIVNQLNDRTYFDFNAVLASPSQLE